MMPSLEEVERAAAAYVYAARAHDEASTLADEAEALREAAYTRLMGLFNQFIEQAGGE